MSGSWSISPLPTATVTQVIPSISIQLTGIPLPTMSCPKPVRTCKRDRDILWKRSAPVQFLPEGTVNVSPVNEDTFTEISKCCGSATIWAYPELCTAWCDSGNQTLAELNTCFWLPTRRGLKPGLTAVSCNGMPEDCGNIDAPGNTTTIWIAGGGAITTATRTGPSPITTGAESALSRTKSLDASTSTLTSLAMSSPSSAVAWSLRSVDSMSRKGIAAVAILCIDLIFGFL